MTIESDATLIEPERSAPRWRARAWLAVRLIVPVAALGYLFTIIPLSDLAASLAKVAPAAVVVSVITAVLGVLLMAVRWRILFRACGVAEPPGLTRLFRLHLIGMFYNTCLPGGLGGEVVRAVATRDAVGGRGLPGSAAIVLLERALGLAGLFITVGAGLALFPLDAEHAAGLEHAWALSAAGLAIAVAAVAAIANAHRLAPLLPQPFGTWAAALPAIESKPHFAAALALSVATKSVVIIIGHTLISSIAGDVAIADSVVLLPLAGAAQYFPLTVGGAGVREAAFVVLYALADVPAADAFAASLVYAGVYYALGAAGGVLHALAPLSGAAQAAKG